MQPHDAIYHYGVKGMRWGRRKSYEEKQARDRAEIKEGRALIKKARGSEKKFGSRYGAQMLEYKRLHSLERKTIARENVNDFKKLYSNKKTNPLLSKEGRVKGMQANKKYYDKLAKAERANSKRSLSYKDKNFWDKINAKAADARAGRAEYESRMTNRRIQKALKQPVDKINSADKKRMMADVAVAAAMTYVVLKTIK